MSKIYEHENQLIIRFPLEIADKIREAMDKNPQMKIDVHPKLQSGLKFDVEIKDLNFKDMGTLVELPTITESYKTRDYINLFKSNDINQMIWVGKMSNVREVEGKVVLDSGLTPPTYDIRRDFFRKQPDIKKEDIQRVEGELDRIQKDSNFGQDDNDDDENPGKKKKKYNKQQQQQQPQQ